MRLNGAAICQGILKLLRFRLRTFLVAWTLCAVWLGTEASARIKRDRALRELKSAGAVLATCISESKWFGKLEGPREEVLAIANSGCPGFGGMGDRERIERDPAEPLSDIEAYFIVNVGQRAPYVPHNPMVGIRWSSIRSLRYCRMLRLPDSNLSDNDLEHVAQLSNLQYLYIPNTRISDRGLSHLHGLKYLAQIDVRGTHVTLEGIESFQRAFPDGLIYSDFSAEYAVDE